MNTPLAVNFEDVKAAAARLRGNINTTPVLTSTTANRRTGAQVFFKCENFQRTGSFKFRGAFNALSSLSPEEKKRGVFTYSSGNHAQAIARAGQMLGIPTTIIMPDNAPIVKREATAGYGAEIVLYQPSETVREDYCRQRAEERGGTIIPPYNHPHIIAGQGTTALELIETAGKLDLLLVCCGGGGLLSGCAIAARELSPNCRIIGVEPEQADDATRSFYTKTLHKINNPDTIADGARTPYLGSLTFPIILAKVDEMVTVSEDAIARAMFFLWERLKIVVEPTGALATAALLDGVVKAENRRVGVIISGGNVDLKGAIALFEKC
ncbi:threo-3-hydroxy-L-aspartate ammonia-lyase [Lyngbya sp. CCY1209]|uniref:threo-3-hydroxy-L-aspartate ammonia-lyase n=1 Tax=Lyngbya sp. CCY1209 TaxID=2886103 RepID=UPI002D1FCE06|nr:threo-3-hydroxy-L-aspartate ammonia-lyase [Lyngbya sp. CCY1209]MEB3885726.1 threo-3-hydroxy-L-aspartate ammonia-lyase [Lyngbya sp. CCY1209]